MAAANGQCVGQWMAEKTKMKKRVQHQIRVSDQDDGITTHLISLIEVMITQDPSERLCSSEVTERIKAIRGKSKSMLNTYVAVQ